MKRSKIKNKYLLQNKDNSNISNTISDMVDEVQNKSIKATFSFFLIILMLIWGIIPNIFLSNIGINPDTLSDTLKYFIALLNDLLFLILLIGIYFKTIRDNFTKYFNNNFKDNFKLSISYWVMGLGIMVVSNYIIAIVMNGQLAENEEALRNMINIVPWYMAFQIIIYAPISEELIFRKSIRDAINNKWLYILVSGIVFGGLHAVSSITHDITSLLYLIPYCSLGIVFGALYTKSDNIFSTIVIHAIHNSLAFILYLGAL